MALIAALPAAAAAAALEERSAESGSELRHLVPLSGPCLHHSDASPLSRDAIQVCGARPRAGIACFRSKVAGRLTPGLSPTRPRRTPQERIDAAVSGETPSIVCIWANTSRAIKLGGHELTLVGPMSHRAGPVTLRSAALSPVTPRFDCELRSRFLRVVVNVDARGGEQPPRGTVWRLDTPAVEVAGFELRRGRAPHGAFLSFSMNSSSSVASAPRVAVSVKNMTFVDGAATATKSETCASRAWTSGTRSPACFSGGGAISADNVPVVLVEGVRAVECTSCNAGGVLAARGVSFAHVVDVVADNVRAGTFGGCVSLWSGEETFDGEWHASGAAISNTVAGEGGGAISYFAAGGVSGNASWSVSGTMISGAVANFDGVSPLRLATSRGGGISLAALGDVGGSASWSVTGATIFNASAGHAGGGVSFYAGSDVQGNASWSLSDTTASSVNAGNAGGGAAFYARKDVGERASWSVLDTTIINASAWKGGGVSFKAFNNVDGSASWFVTGSIFSNVSTSNHNGASGGAIFFSGGANIGGDASWSVSAVSISNVSADGNQASGGGISFMANKIAQDSPCWFVSGVTLSNARTEGYQARGGGISFFVNEGVGGNASWSISDTLISHAKASGGLAAGGGVSFFTYRDVTGTVSWSVKGSHLRAVSAAGNGGGISYQAGNDVSGSVSWSVAGATISSASANGQQGTGGGISFYSSRSVGGNTSWSVSDSRLADTVSMVDGGGVQFYAGKRLHSSAPRGASWSLSRTSFVSARSLRGSGGAVSLRCFEATDTAFGIESLTCSNTSAGQSGGCIAFQSQGAIRSYGTIRGLIASRVSALSGGAISVVVSARISHDYKDAPMRSLALSVNDTAVEYAHATGRGGVLCVEVASPAIHPFRTWDASCLNPADWCSQITCPMRYNSSVLPFVRETEVTVGRLKAAFVSTGANGQGGLASLSNTVARLTNISLASVSSGFAGGVLAIFDSSDVSVSKLRGSNVSAPNGALLYHSGAGANVTIEDVWLDTESSFSSDTGPKSAGIVTRGGHDVSWIRSGAVSLAEARHMYMGCPLGAAVLNDSTGSFEQSYPSLPAVKQSVNEQVFPCSLATGMDYSPRTFRYSSSRIGCKKCPPGKYTLVKQGWIRNPRAQNSSALCAPRAGIGFSALLQPTVPWYWTQCFSCPIGADCSRGGSAVVPQPGRWGTATRSGHGQNGPLLITPFPVLLFDYACPSNASGCLSHFDACNGHRVGVACGQCDAGYGEALNSAQCIGEGACRGSALRVPAWVLLAGGVVGIVLFYVVCSGADALEEKREDPSADLSTPDSALRWRGVTTGLVSILVSLFQVEGIVRADDQGSASVFAHASQLQLIPSWFGDHVCLWPGMGTVTKAMLPAMLSLSAVLILVYAAHLQLASSGLSFVRRAVGTLVPSRGRYKRAFVSLMVFAYGALASVATKLVTPLEVASYGRRQALTGDVWGQEWYFWVGAAWLCTSTLWAPLYFAWGMAHQRARTMDMDEFAWGVVFPIPVVAWRAVRHAAKCRAGLRSTESRKGARTMFTLLSAPYRDGRW